MCVIDHVVIANKSTEGAFALKMAAKIFNCSHVLFGKMLPERKLITSIDNYPVNWHDRYFSQQHYHIDPVILRTARTLSPFHWGQSHFTKNKQQQELYSFAQEQGLDTGLAIRFADSNFLSLASSQPQQDYQKFLKSEKAHLLPNLFMMNTYLSLLEQPYYCKNTAAQLLNLINHCYQEQQRRRKATQQALHYFKAFGLEIDMTLPAMMRTNLLWSYRELYRYFDQL